MKQTSLILPILALVLVLLITVFVRASATQARIADGLVRFHVIANSDLPRDQELKGKVRDAVVKKAEDLTRKAEGRDEALQLLSVNLAQLEKTANAVLLYEGAPYSARATVTHRYFPTKSYAGFRLPAGDYDAVTLTLGEGLGQNFWCVLFPPLCVTPVSIREAETDLTQEELALLSEDDPVTRYEFFLVELAGKIAAKLS